MQDTDLAKPSQILAEESTENTAQEVASRESIFDKLKQNLDSSPPKSSSKQPRVMLEKITEFKKSETSTTEPDNITKVTELINLIESKYPSDENKNLNKQYHPVKPSKSQKRNKKGSFKSPLAHLERSPRQLSLQDSFTRTTTKSKENNGRSLKRSIFTSKTENAQKKPRTDAHTPVKRLGIGPVTRLAKSKDIELDTTSSATADSDVEQIVDKDPLTEAAKKSPLERSPILLSDDDTMPSTPPLITVVDLQCKEKQANQILNEAFREDSEGDDIFLKDSVPIEVNESVVSISDQSRTKDLEYQLAFINTLELERERAPREKRKVEETNKDSSKSKHKKHQTFATVEDDFDNISAIFIKETLAVNEIEKVRELSPLAGPSNIENDEEPPAKKPAKDKKSHKHKTPSTSSSRSSTPEKSHEIPYMRAKRSVAERGKTKLNQTRNKFAEFRQYREDRFGMNQRPQLNTNFKIPKKPKIDETSFDSHVHNIYKLTIDQPQEEPDNILLTDDEEDLYGAGDRPMMPFNAY